MYGIQNKQNFFLHRNFGKEKLFFDLFSLVKRVKNTIINFSSTKKSQYKTQFYQMRGKSNKGITHKYLGTFP